MPALPQPNTVSEAEYLAFEQASEGRHEFINGQIIAISGASRAHVLIVSMTVHLLMSQLRGKPCEVYANDMRVKVAPSGLYTYPDVAVVCADPQFTDDPLDTLLNPTVIVEVLSPSTEAYDRGEEFRSYRKISTLQHYLLIAQDRPSIERYTRQPKGEWLLTEVIGINETIALPAINCTLALAEIYERVSF